MILGSFSGSQYLFCLHLSIVNIVRDIQSHSHVLASYSYLLPWYPKIAAARRLKHVWDGVEVALVLFLLPR